MYRVGVPRYGDPDGLDRLAARLRERAGEIRRDAAGHQRQGQAAHWVSTAAQAYRERVAADRADADRAAAELEHAADVLRAHAQQVRETIALIERYEREVTSWFEHQARSLAHTVEDAVDSAGRAVNRLVADVPWRSWPIGPTNLPVPGDARWLEVGEFMRRQGVL